MNREELIRSAQSLKKPAESALKEFSEKRQEMVAKVNQDMGTRLDLEKLVGPDGKKMSEDNNHNFSLFMESLLEHFQAETLVDTGLWVLRTYRAHGFHVSYWPANLHTWVQVLQDSLSPEAYNEIVPFYNWL